MEDNKELKKNKEDSKDNQQDNKEEIRDPDEPIRNYNPDDGFEAIIDAEEAKDNYTEETFNICISSFLTEGYDITRRELKAAYRTKDTQQMKKTTHTLKTTVRYMCVENLALECQKIEDLTKTADWVAIDKLYPPLMRHLEKLYVAVKKMDDEIQGVSNTGNILDGLNDTMEKLATQEKYESEKNDVLQRTDTIERVFSNEHQSIISDGKDPTISEIRDTSRIERGPGSNSISGLINFDSKFSIKYRKNKGKYVKSEKH